MVEVLDKEVVLDICDDVAEEQEFGVDNLTEKGIKDFSIEVLSRISEKDENIKSIEKEEGDIDVTYRDDLEENEIDELEDHYKKVIAQDYVIASLTSLVESDEIGIMQKLKVTKKLLEEFNMEGE